MARTTIAVDGMACTGCEETVTDALSDLEGVESVDADHEAGSVTVEHDDAVSVDDLTATINDAGYDVAA